MMDGGWMMGWMWIWPLVLLVGLLVLVYLAVRLTNRPQQDTRPSARQVLDERYARGEIDEEEYRRRRTGLD